MHTTKNAIALAIGTAFIASIATTPASAAQNPFALKTLTSGYMVADADKMKDGKCGTGQCAANKAKMPEKAAEATTGVEKTKEASCSADKAKEGSCHADKK